ncbi:hypothetical protein BCON_0102g00370 [Botryotinia convoluta]|uniref:Heterokaryon incompatibility domain-containing protein n=1 Tax=Botryotinia convoluta TaxID=54673 RepID=A0A4Z1I7H5_9HELO|nr:hypothetical protein BCON_0102g00370 [Botryotinia convoluta]
MSGTLTTCATCERIIDFSDTATRRDNVILGSVSSLVETECPHRRWITNFDPDGDSIQIFSEFRIGMFKMASSIVLRSSRNGTGSLGRAFEFVREKNDEYSNSRRARILDPIWIDEGIVLNWKDLCDKHHGTACEYPEKLTRMDAIQPTWLIDTVAGCLVPGREYLRFVTLSYVRGKTVPFYSEKSNIDRLQEVGVLSKESVADKLPMTIRNAIDVVRLIGERYLWVDTLCIVQDDAETLQDELNSMARVYTTSCITIVATDGIDANHGLRGFKGITSQRDFKQNVMSMGSPVKLINPRSRNEKTNTLYHLHAWTYQENLFAKRRLFFENGTVYWECSRSSWEEELFPDLPPFKLQSVDPLEPPELFMTSSFPDMKNMNCLLREFNQKVLTFPNHALAAFSDISTKAEKEFSSSSELKDNENFTNVKLQDPNGEVVGFLTLICERDRAHFTQNATPGALVELVAISQGWFGVSTKSGEEEKEVKDWFPDHMTRQDCYHVLWVEWENGIAYRRGNGCVVKEVWEREREEELLDLVLG